MRALHALVRKAASRYGQRLPRQHQARRILFRAIFGRDAQSIKAPPNDIANLLLPHFRTSVTACRWLSSSERLLGSIGKP